MRVGEQPGDKEDLAGKPFVHPAIKDEADKEREYRNFVADLRPAARVAGERGGLTREALFLFGEPSAHQGGERVEHLGRLPSARFDRDRRAGSGCQHHEAHDRGAADGLVAALDLHVGVELFHGLHELGGGARVQALLVADFEHADDRRRIRGMIAEGGVWHAGSLAYLPERTRLAMVMYLRPESWAAATASVSGHSSRTLASLTSIGRLIPARTSTLGRPITEMARLEGVPPNMSVRMATPSPLSTRLTASMMSLRRCSTSSSGPMVTASICFCGPTTCSKAERNSAARRPCVTSTRPIMQFPAGASPVHRTKGGQS